MLTARKSGHVARFILPAVAMALAVPSAYGDSILPAASGSLESGGISTIVPAPGTSTCDQCVIDSSTGLPADIFSTVTASYDGLIGSSVTGNGSANGGIGSAGSALLIYDFEVAGSAPGVFTVPVIVTFSLLTDETAATNFAAEAQAFFAVGGMGTSICSSVPVVTGCALGSSVLLGATTTYNATPGSLVPIDIRIDASTFNGTWAATVDPTLEIDPTFPFAADFTLEASPVTNSAPEPPTSLLLGTVLLALLAAGMVTRLRHSSSL